MCVSCKIVLLNILMTILNTSIGDNADILSLDLRLATDLNSVECVRLLFAEEDIVYGLYLFDQFLEPTVVDKYFMTIRQIAEKYSTWEFLPLSTDSKWKTQFKIYDGDPTVTRIDHIVFVVRNLRFVKEFFDIWYRSKWYNQHSKIFIVYLPTDGDVEVVETLVADLMKTAWLTYSYPLVILNNDDQNNKECNLYVTDKNQKTIKNCGPTAIRKQEVKTLRDIRLLDLYSSWSEFSGCSIDILAMAIEPYVLIKKINGKETTQGLEPTMLELITTYKNITVNYLKHNFSTWGSILGTDSNRTYTDMYQALLERKADLIMGNVRSIATLLFDFSGSHQYLPTELRFYVPKAGNYPAWVNMATVFTSLTWAGLLVALLAYIIIRHILQSTKCNESKYPDGCTPSLEGLSLVVARSTRQPFLLKNRILFISFALFSFVYSSSFENMLVSFLVQPISEYQPKTYKDLAESDLILAGTGFSRDAFSDNRGQGDEAIRKIYKRWHDVSIGELIASLQRGADRKDTATHHNQRTVAYMMKFENRFVKKNVSQLYIMPPTITFYTQLLMQKGHPFKKILDPCIQRFLEFGILNHIEDHYSRFVDTPEYITFFPFRLENILLAFFIYAIGIVMSASAFIMELLKM